MKVTQEPVLRALVLADHIYTDESGKRIICGTFSKIGSTKFPSFFVQPTWAFVLLADVVGKMELQLKFVHLDNNEILMQSPKVPIESTDPLVPVDIAMMIPQFPLPEPGAYGVECYADDALLGCARVQVEQLEIRGGSNDNDN